MSYIGQELGQGRAARETFTASGGETSVNTNYTPGQLSVYLNGVKLVNAIDFTATNGTSITGLTALAANDVMDFVALENFLVSNTVEATGGTFLGPVVFDGDIKAGTIKANDGTAALTIADSTGTVSLAGTLGVTGTTTLTGATTITGDLTVNGTTTTLNTQTVEVEDNILQLNTTQASPDTATAATSGFSVYRGNGVTQASLIFDDADDTWDLTNNIVVAGTINGTDINNAGRVTNLGVGVTALDSITTGDNNVALGDNALTSCTDGYFNTATGRYAMENTTSANQNAASGYCALRLNETGERNTAMGAKALRSLATGDFNTAVGYYALYLTNGANWNTAVGFDAGKSIVGGNTNTILGAKAGDNITTGSSNIIIGYNIDAGSATGSNQLNIGDTIYGDLSTGKVGIGGGATSPAVALEVALTGAEEQVRVRNPNTAAGQHTYLTVKPSSTTGSSYLKLADNDDTYVNYIWTDYSGGSLRFNTNGHNIRMDIDTSGHVTPGADNTQDLGSSSKRWRNIYTTDLHLANDRGNWTVIEEEDYLTLRNNKTNKVYKLVMEEIE